MKRVIGKYRGSDVRLFVFSNGRAYISSDDFMSPTLDSESQVLAWWEHMQDFTVPESDIERMTSALKVLASGDPVHFKEWMHDNDMSTDYEYIVNMSFGEAMRSLVIAIARRAVSGISWHEGESAEKLRMVKILKILSFPDNLTIEQIRNNARYGLTGHGYWIDGD